MSELFKKLYETSQGVPVYIRAPDFYRHTRKLSARELRAKYPCFVSENVRWKSKVTPITHSQRDDKLEASYKLAHLVVMARTARERKPVVMEELERMGYKLNPYSLASDYCVGFYAKSFDEVYKVAESLSNKVDSMAVVNAIWYMRFNYIFNLRRLAEAGFVHHSNSVFKAVMVLFNYTPMRVFFNGSVGVYAPHTTDSLVELGLTFQNYVRTIGAVV